jgi:hypothetical protein
VGSADFTEDPVSKRNQNLIRNTQVARTQHQTYVVFSKNVSDAEIENWRQAYDSINITGHLDFVKQKYLLPYLNALS